MSTFKLSIITPTYNRGYILINLYHSLCRQTNKSFEWIIIDDGSNDGTQTLVEEWTKENIDFTIKYFKQNNGGKHRALNNGITKAKYDYIYIIDSDDYMTDDAVENIYSWIDSIKNENYESFAGVSGLRGTKANETLGQFPEKNKYVDATNLERKKYKLLGDKAEIYKKEILLKYPFPEFDNETFLGEGAVWNRIAGDGYKIRWFGKIICVCEYLEDGLTKNYDHQVLLRNFNGYTYVEKMNVNLRKFPDNFLAIGRYIFMAKQKNMSMSQIRKELELSQSKFFIGFAFGVFRIIIRKMIYAVNK